MPTKIIKDIFKINSNPKYDLPYCKTLDDGDYFPAFIESKLNDYYFQIIDVIPNFLKNDFSKKYKSIQKAINKSLQEYYEGKIFAAFQPFEEAFQKYLLKIFKDLNSLFKKLYNYSKSRLFSDEVLQCRIKDVYRARKSNLSLNSIQLPQDLYHPPYSLRHKLNNERYSISGNPCLYLAESAYCSWIEMDRPNFHDFNLSRYRYFQPDFTFIDLSWRPISFSFIIDGFAQSQICNYSTMELQEEIVNYISLWPIFFVNSLIPNETRENSYFVPEYIFPQFLMQLVKQTSGFDGIKYFSMKRYKTQKNYIEYGLNELYTDFLLINYAIPTSSPKNPQEKYCHDLLSKFSISYPTSTQLIEIQQDNRDKPQTLYMNNLQAKIENLPISHYGWSKFGKLEQATYRIQDGLWGMQIMLLDGNYKLSRSEFEGLFQDCGARCLRQDEFPKYFPNIFVGNEIDTLLSQKHDIKGKERTFKSKDGFNVEICDDNIKIANSIFYNDKIALKNLFHHDFLCK